MMHQHIMHLLLACVLPLIAAELVSPPPRPIPASFKNKLPPDLRRLPDNKLRNLPNGYVRQRFGDVALQQYQDFGGVCGGIPSQPGNFQRAVRGQSLQFDWNVDASQVGGQCRLVLMHPGRERDRQLWAGDCRNARHYSQRVVIPRDFGPCPAGECFVQWSLSLSNGNQYYNCVDYEIE